MKAILYRWLLVGLAGLCVLPWYQQEAGLFSGQWLSASAYLSQKSAPAVIQFLMYGAADITAPIGLVIVALALNALVKDRRTLGRGMIAVGIAGLLVMGWIGWGAARPFAGLGYGALLTGLCFLFLVTTGAAACGVCRGDAFVAGTIGLIIALISMFVLYPVLVILASAFQGDGGELTMALLAERFSDNSIWSLRCMSGGHNCGVAWNTLYLALATGIASTMLGLVFALLVTRVNGRWAKPIRAVTILPIVTPPFVLGLALILLFGRNGAITTFISNMFGIAPGRWLYGMSGVWLAQILAFAPIAFMTLIGVVEGVSPSLEEAATTLGASSWQTFCKVSIPLMRPGIANAFLLCFIESMADFGNPMVLGGNFHVLSTEIYFAVVGAANDQARAATLAIVLLFLAIGAFLFQNIWLGRKSYVTVTGKADHGGHGALNPRLKIALWSIAVPWIVFTLIVYGTVAVGGFVNNWGQDNTLTLSHYIDAFGISGSLGDLHWDGQAWPSLFTTLTISAIATPLTAFVGILSAWLLVRQQFALKRVFEFGTMLSFAIPGTVIGISYILAFNAAPIELTGTATILVLCFVFRNMPMGLRTGIAAMRQLDGSLDEASITLGANSWTTMRRVILPLLRPAIASALVYGFVRSITSISAVVFLVSADYDMATSYIIGLVSNGNYGTAIAYATALIVIIMLCILFMNTMVGKRRLRRTANETAKSGQLLKKSYA
ncbi:MAG TPA: iron ABC transporter permease [Noviherbaspirillum sp.]